MIKRTPQLHIEVKWLVQYQSFSTFPDTTLVPHCPFLDIHAVNLSTRLAIKFQRINLEQVPDKVTRNQGYQLKSRWTCDPLSWFKQRLSTGLFLGWNSIRIFDSCTRISSCILIKLPTVLHLNTHTMKQVTTN